MNRREDQEEIQAMYVTGKMTLKELSKETGIAMSTLTRWSKENKWADKRKKAEQRAVRNAVTKHVTKRARALEKLLEVSDRSEDALKIGLEQLITALNAGDAVTVNGETVSGMADGSRTRNLESMINAISRAVDTRFRLSQLMDERDRQHIDIEKRKQKLAEKEAMEAKDINKEVHVIMDGTLEELSK